MRPEELKGMILAFVVGIILTVAGFIATNITYGFGLYVYQQVNSTIQQPMLIKAEDIRIVGLALQICGIVIVVSALGIMIKSMISTATEATAT